ncbi:MAG: nicotinate-nucleotide--dimethylbenzimidazole phosphoribosyltransferase [Nitrospinae bacterium]|nr:nicotinate-nucleotide--dimethylbenzimidazole phosphoribosyltransferase [Nitrospinota bacterium]
MGLLEETIQKINPASAEGRRLARERIATLTMPYWALGRVLDLAESLAGMAGGLSFSVSRKTVVVMAGDHGVCAEGVSKYPKDVTPQMVANFIQGGAGVNAIAKVSGARVVVVDMGVDADLAPMAEDGKLIIKKIRRGTSNIATGPAMSREEAVASIEAGIEVARSLAGSTDVFGTGDMGIGNTTPSSAIVSAITGRKPSEITGRGTGIDDSQLRHKVSVVERALAVNRPDPADGVDVLAKVGGFEIGGIAGLILGAASMRKPVVIDGFISTAGALIAKAIKKESSDYMIAAHLSVEPGHRAMLEHLGAKAHLDLDMRLGEGSGAALAMCIVEAAQRVLTEMATFDSAGVSQSDE